MDKNFNTAPYYDDFDESKNYLRILFKPGFAVQARELTQLQTSIQRQIKNFGSHVFKDGSIVLNGNTNLFDVNWVDVNSTDATAAISTVITGGTSGARGKVISAEKISTTTYRLYFSYINGKIFEAQEVITTDNLLSYSIADEDIFSGTSKMFSIEPSVFYIKGNFVYCEKQQIPVTTYFVSSNSKIGLDVVEDIVTSDSDNTLLDPAQGSYNFAAPGADRYTVSLTLNIYQYDPQNESDISTGNFIELARLQGDKLISKVTSSSYSDLETTFARRTYDESGDYTVKSFGLKVKSHIYGDTNKLSLAVDPGKAYVKGYEFQTIATQHIDLDKARDLDFSSGSIVESSYGSYVYVSTPSGYIDYGNNSSVTLKNSSSTTIGTANLSNIIYHSSGVYKLYLFNASLNAGYSFADLDSLVSGSWSADISTATYGSNPVSLISSSSRTNIVKLPNDNISTLLTDDVSDTQYTAHKTFTATFSDVGGGVYSATLSTGSSTELFLSSDTSDYVIVNPSTGAIVAISSITGSGNSRTITIGSSISNAKIYTKVGISSAAQKNKSLVTGTLSDHQITSEQISLEKSDCYAITSITAKSTFNVSVPNIDVTEMFVFNNGQKDELYDHGWIKLKSGMSISSTYDVIDVEFTYFSHSSTNGFFSVDSYSGVLDYENIPTYVSTKGEYFKLSDCLDFRPVRVNGGTAINGSYKIDQDSLISADYSYYLARIDKLVLTKERKLSVVRGIPAINPIVPEDLFDAMTLYVINIPPYTISENDVTYSYIDNKRYTMRDIGKIDKRVNQLEYYTSLSFLEKQAKDESIPSDTPGLDRYKNGILVDSFAGHSIGNPGNPDYACSIDKNNRILRPKFSSFSHTYAVNSLTDAIREKDLISLNYDTEVLVEQPYATSWVNVNPYMVFEWNGRVTLTPATDTWVETHVQPDVTINLNGENDVYTILNQDSANTNSLGVVWDDWRTVVKGVTSSVVDNYGTTTNSSTITDASTGGKTVTNSTLVTNAQSVTTTDVSIKSGVEILTSSTKTLTSDLGTKVIDTSIVPYIRSKVLDFAAQHMKPETTLYATFDGIDVTDYCLPAVEIVVNGTFDKTAEKVKSGSKVATILLAKSDRVFVKTDADSTGEFEQDDQLSWYVNGSWTTSGSASSVTRRTSLETNENGDIAGYFDIPDPNAGSIKFRTGELIFRLSDSLSKNSTTAAEVKYIAQGLSQSTERTLVSTRVASATVKPVSNINTTSTTSVKNIVISESTAVVQIPPPPPPITLACSSKQFSNSTKGTFEYNLDLGSNVGSAGIKINPTNGIPVRYTLTWDGKTYTSGFIGNPSYDDQLIANGYPKVTTNSQSSLSFNKTSANPSNAKLKIESPIAGSDWGVQVWCADPPIAAPTYSIYPDITTVAEGGNVTFNVVTTGVAAGTTLYWTLNSNSTVSSADFSDGATSGTVIVNAVGITSFTKTLSSDLSSEGAETFSIDLRTNSASGSIVAHSSTVTVTDTSVSVVPRYAITASTTSINEGGTVTFVISTGNVNNGTTLYWNMAGSPTTAASSDFVGGTTSGSVTINNNSALFTVSTINDSSNEGNETFTVQLLTGSTSGTVVARAATVTIIESFVPAPTFNVQPNLSSIGNRTVGNIAWCPHTPVMSESKSLGAPINASWTATKNGSAISSNVKYRLTGITSSDSRIKLFSTNQTEKYAHAGWPGTINSVTPLREVKYPPGNKPGYSWFNWDWWEFQPPAEMTSMPPVNQDASSGTPVPIFMVFNPYDGSIMTGQQYNYDSATQAALAPTGQAGPFNINFNITTTWTYISGDDTIPVEKRILTVTQPGSINITSIGQYDPVAQTFFINASQYPNGVFVKSVDLYFKNKSQWAPCELQLRPVVNGYPSSSTILQFGVVIKDASEINVSSTGDVSTNFEFENIIHLSPGEYAFVVVANTDEYELFTSVIGDFTLTNTSQRVTTQPVLGSMFKSQNASAWTPIQEEDIKFRINKCVFDTAVDGTVVYDTDISSLTGDISYDVFYAGGEVIDFGDTNIDYSYKTENDAFVNYQIGTNVELVSAKTLDSSDGSSLQFKTVLSTNDRNITPVVDLNRLSNVLISNVINNDSSNETDAFGGSSIAKYITRSVKLNPGFDSTDLKVFFSAKKPTGTDVKVYYKVSAATDNVFDDNEYTEMELESAGTYSENSYSEYKYKTPWDTAFENGDRFDTFSVKIVMLSNTTTKVPLVKDLRVVALDD